MAAELPKFYLKRFEGFLDIEDEVAQYIKDKARKDLPESQFTCVSDLKYPRDKNKLDERVLEIGGMLGYNGALYELAYSKNCKVTHEIKENLLQSMTMLSYGFSPKNIKEGTTAIIRWHTHARNTNITENDAIMGAALAYLLSDFLYCDVLYCPGYDELSWYEYLEADKLNNKCII